MCRLRTLSLLVTLFCSLYSSGQVTTIAGPQGSGDFGYSVTALKNGNYVITDPYISNGAIPNAGAVYLYDGKTHTLISTLKGSLAYDFVGMGGVIPLTNGNFVVISRFVDNGAAVNCGAITWVDGVSGLSGVVTPANSLFGTTTGDSLASGDRNFQGGIVVLDNGNYAVVSPAWDNGTVINAGAVTLLDGNSPTSGYISSANSLVGTRANDRVGYDGIFLLDNSHFIVRSFEWNNGIVVGAGAITWSNGMKLTGEVSSVNSLVGTTTGDFLDNINMTENRIRKLTNGNFVVINPNWDDVAGGIVDAGAATWGSNTVGLSGAISSSNSLVGSTNYEQVGGGAGQNMSAVVALVNGNYVVATPGWDNGYIADAGAVTWGNGNTGVTGIITPANSLVGSSVSDEVGSSVFGWCGVVPLANGNYVVGTAYWNNGSAEDVGAITWGDGSSGVKGEISAANSILGSTASDFTGNSYHNSLITALNNGNFVVSAPNWDNGGVVNAGAVMWANGQSPITGTIDSSTALIGTRADDGIGFVTALPNGNYVVCSPFWDNDAIVDAGAVTWVDGRLGKTGFVNSANSLVGSHANDMIGRANEITVLKNGNYVISSSDWDNEAAIDAGAATCVNGLVGATGIIDRNNSLVGTTSGDRVGAYITGLANGNYVVSSPIWQNGSIAVGAVTWADGMTGISGPVTGSNSLVGSHAPDYVGWVVPLENGNYIVLSQEWNNNGPGTGKGAVTWGNGLTGITGIVGNSNSLIGISPGDFVGENIALGKDHYIIISPQYDNGYLTDAGALTYASTTSSIAGVISHCNSVLGQAPDVGRTFAFSYSDNPAYLIVGHALHNTVFILQPSSSSLAATRDSASASINGTATVQLLSADGCQLIASLTPQGSSPVNGNVMAKTWNEAAVPVHNGEPFVARHYEITPALNVSTATARVTLYFTQQDFDNFNAHPGSTLDMPVDQNDVAGIANVRVGKYAGTSNDFTGLPETYTGTFSLIDPADNDIVWNNTLLRWEISFDVTGFSGFILQTNIPLLPLTLLEFTGRLVNDNADLKWKTTDEFNTSSFEIERSIDGMSYRKVGSTAAANQPGIHIYTFTDKDIARWGVPLVYYRLKSVDIDGRFSYSGIVVLTVNTKTIVSLYPNPVKGNAMLAVTVSEPSMLQLRIIDNTGRTLRQEQLNVAPGNNTRFMEMSRLAAGNYCLELTGKNFSRQIRFIKM